ncbi:hypothetical protein BU26DRAFT_571657 [Trematosphaeria pertusa]|uniref:Ubiquitin-like protease family profile domain-containing protein n=1 Tax=Trematosphaeria pertusa TaxID=390896 RepID=A0A6A6HVQ5_9PLEO|nr:uncharacterized protein BU26DRAFT_571657 [Trematosphaeria pertusa]KAF2241500.1 hypothetical protein BU26DRAFT_571657 [Trematosphaeria pertusa]
MSPVAEFRPLKGFASLEAFLDALPTPCSPEDRGRYQKNLAERQTRLHGFESGPWRLTLTRIVNKFGKEVLGKRTLLLALADWQDSMDCPDNGEAVLQLIQAEHQSHGDLQCKHVVAAQEKWESKSIKLPLTSTRSLPWGKNAANPPTKRSYAAEACDACRRSHKRCKHNAPAPRDSITGPVPAGPSQERSDSVENHPEPATVPAVFVQQVQSRVESSAGVPADSVEQLALVETSPAIIQTGHVHRVQSTKELSSIPQAIQEKELESPEESLGITYADPVQQLEARGETGRLTGNTIDCLIRLAPTEKVLFHDAGNLSSLSLLRHWKPLWMNNRYDSKKGVIVPFNIPVPGGHWVLVYYDKEQKISLFDSAPRSTPLQDLEDIALHIGEAISPNHTFTLNENWHGNVPTQQDGYNCGVYTVFAAWRLILDGCPDILPQDIEPNLWRTLLAQALRPDDEALKARLMEYIETKICDAPTTISCSIPAVRRLMEELEDTIAREKYVERYADSFADHAVRVSNSLRGNAVTSLNKVKERLTRCKEMEASMQEYAGKYKSAAVESTLAGMVSESTRVQEQMRTAEDILSHATRLRNAAIELGDIFTAITTKLASKRETLMQAIQDEDDALTKEINERKQYLRALDGPSCNAEPAQPGDKSTLLEAQVYGTTLERPITVMEDSTNAGPDNRDHLLENELRIRETHTGRVDALFDEIKEFVAAYGKSSGPHLVALYNDLQDIMDENRNGYWKEVDSLLSLRTQNPSASTSSKLRVLVTTTDELDNACHESGWKLPDNVGALLLRNAHKNPAFDIGAFATAMDRSYPNTKLEGQDYQEGQGNNVFYDRKEYLQRYNLRMKAHEYRRIRADDLPRNIINLTGDILRSVSEPQAIRSLRWDLLDLLYQRLHSEKREFYSDKGNLAGKEHSMLNWIHDLSACHRFCLFADRGAPSVQHVDLLNGTWVTCLSGYKLWFIYDGIWDEKTKEDFENRRHLPTEHWKLILLGPGDTLIMRPGHCVIHSVITLDDAIMAGGMIWPREGLADVMQNMEYIMTHLDTTNEQVPKQLPEYIECLLTLAKEQEAEDAEMSVDNKAPTSPSPPFGKDDEFLDAAAKELSIQQLRGYGLQITPADVEAINSLKAKLLPQLSCQCGSDARLAGVRASEQGRNAVPFATHGLDATPVGTKADNEAWKRPGDRWPIWKGL